GFQVDCGLRIQGGAFRSHGLTLKHSLRLLFKGLYGPTKLDWPLLGPDATDRFDTLTLRANSNDGWQWGAANGQPLYIRDAFGRQTMRAMGGVASHSAFFHVFINGVYWGLYEATERPDAAFSATYLGGDKADWDGQNSGSAVDGDLLAWQALIARLGEGVADLESWYALQGLDPAGVPDPLRPRWVDMQNLADYMLTNLYVGNTDWPRKNFYVGRPRDGRLGFHFYMWDSEWSLGLRSNLQTDRTGVDVGVAQPWDALKTNPEFRLLVADRARRHLATPGGALWVDPAAPAWDPAQPERNVPAARFAALAEAVRAPLTLESARWGDQHRAESPYTVEAEWRAEPEGLLADYFPRRSAVFLDQLRAADLYPAVEPAQPDHWGGRVDQGFALTLTAPEGAAVIYTVDGGDPRLPGGEVSPAATAVEGAAEVLLAARGLGVEVFARVRAPDGTWSAATVVTFDVF
ncbi:MAG: CotH kinase family protein, partial [Myxococcales bacterium]|nr:CotH kinase family protein [Myxococcales bacterium]